MLDEVEGPGSPRRVRPTLATRLLAADDSTAAHNHAAPAIAAAPAPAAMRLRLADLPELARLRDDPAWRPLLALSP